MTEYVPPKGEYETVTSTGVWLSSQHVYPVSGQGEDTICTFISEQNQDTLITTPCSGTSGPLLTPYT